jgi:hypothetical protein
VKYGSYKAGAAAPAVQSKSQKVRRDKVRRGG